MPVGMRVSVAVVMGVVPPMVVQKLASASIIGVAGVVWYGESQRMHGLPCVDRPRGSRRGAGWDEKSLTVSDFSSHRPVGCRSAERPLYPAAVDVGRRHRGLRAARPLAIALR